MGIFYDYRIDCLLSHFENIEELINVIVLASFIGFLHFLKSKFKVPGISFKVSLALTEKTQNYRRKTVTYSPITFKRIHKSQKRDKRAIMWANRLRLSNSIINIQSIQHSNHRLINLL